MCKVILIVDDVRSAHNVGSLLRTADGLGIEKVYLTGITPYPPAPDDERLPHIQARSGRQIAKTALGAESSVEWHYEESINDVINKLRSNGYEIAALEQTPSSISLNKYQPPAKVALVIGNEVDGLSSDILALCSRILEIPMNGSKESFNVAVAAGMALYHLRFSV